jgi:hypothetical protein
MLVIKRIIGVALIVIGLGLFASFLFAPLSSRDRNILHQQAEYGVQGTYPTSDKRFYLLGGFVCCIIGGALFKK